MVPVTGPAAPQPGVPPPADHLPIHPDARAATLWWVGAHGGAGESTFESLVEGSRGAGHAWPAASAGQHCQVVLLARTHVPGLLAAQRELTAWAAGHVDAELLGVALVADAPGRLPRAMRDLSQHVAGGAPRVWHVPWIEEWRLGVPPNPAHCPRRVRTFIRQVTTLIQQKETS